MFFIILNKSILHKSIDLLSRREHSVKELQQNLLQRKFEETEIDQVISYLMENDYLSDQRYADSMFRIRIIKGYGQKHIESELIRKGVSRTIINLIAENQEIDWYDQALITYTKRFGESQILDQKDKAKRIRFLQYRGFSTDQIMTVVNREQEFK